MSGGAIGGDSRTHSVSRGCGQARRWSPNYLRRAASVFCRTFTSSAQVAFCRQPRPSCAAKARLGPADISNHSRRAVLTLEKSFTWRAELPFVLAAAPCPETRSALRPGVNSLFHRAVTAVRGCDHQFTSRARSRFCRCEPTSAIRGSVPSLTWLSFCSVSGVAAGPYWPCSRCRVACSSRRARCSAARTRWRSQ